MKKIKLSGKYGKDKFTIVDDENFEWLNKWKWFCSPFGYALKDKKGKHIFMHRLINNTPDGLFTDHINRNKLDNRKKNLRTATRFQNKINTGLQKNNTSGYKGVSWRKDQNKWQAHLVFNDLRIHLGYYTNILEAWLARKKGERIYYRQAGGL